MATRTTAASVTDAGNEAKTDRENLTSSAKTLPLILGIVGAIALLAGVLLLLLGRRRPPTGTSPISPAPTTLTG